ncbi:MAG: undecaprenyl-diphosphate phosphatase [Planctomycetota bacterium]
MTESLQAAVMGIVEGLTEFLPVSSTGHLILAGRVIGFERTVGDDFAKAFDVVIQIGAILAVVVAYPRRFAGLADFRGQNGFRGLRGIGLLLLTTLPALVFGLLLHKPIKAYLFSPATVAVGLALGAVWILVMERRRDHAVIASVDGLTWRVALAVGFFQCIAMWPGISRSAATILGGMMVGLDRRTATEYSFFAAVPVLAAAAAFDFIRSYDTIDPERMKLLAIGLVVSFFSAWAAVKWLVHFVSRHKLTVFAWYRLALAAVVVGLLWWGR